MTANVINDGINAYAYDAEGRLCAISNSYAGTATGYLYDADGNRVAKGTITSLGCDIASGGNGFQMTNEFLLGPTGNQVTEINNTNDPGVWQWAHSNVWAGSDLDVTIDWMQNTQNSQWNAAVHFQLSDPLGSRRVQTGAVGGWQAQFGTLPFGDEFQEYINTANQFADDATEHHFTGKELDQESGNDYFFARYYNSSMGRFLSPDWSASPEPVPYANLDNPQSLNLYAYVMNNPLSRADADGHFWQELKNFLFDRTHQWKNDAEMVEYRRGILRIHANNQAGVDWANSLKPNEVNFAYKYITNESFREKVDAVLQPAVTVAGAVKDFPTSETNNWSANFKSEGEARAFARSKLGDNPVEVEPGKWRSTDGKWQYRAKPGDVSDNHIHLEELNPDGSVKQNVHLRWPEGTER